MNETEINETNTSKLETAKTAANTVVLFASAIIAAKGLWDLGSDLKDEVQIRRAKKAAAKKEE